MDFKMNKLLKKMMVALLSLGLVQAVWADNVPDFKETFQVAKQEAEQGNALAQYNFGVMYANGEGVRQNYKTAKEWFDKACDNGLQQGCDAYRKLNQAGY